MIQTKKKRKPKFRKTIRYRGGMLRFLSSFLPGAKERAIAEADEYAKRLIEEEEKEKRKVKPPSIKTKLKSVTPKKTYTVSVQPDKTPYSVPVTTDMTPYSVPVPPDMTPIPSPPVMPPIPPPTKRIRIKNETSKDKRNLKKSLDKLEITDDYIELWKQVIGEDVITILKEHAFSINSPCNYIQDYFYISDEPDSELQRILCKTFFILGYISNILEENDYKYRILWKGTRALRLAYKASDKYKVDNAAFKTDDEDIVIIERDPETKSDKKPFTLAICKLLQYMLGGITKISIYEPDANTRNANIYKLSYILPSGGYKAFVDIGTDGITHQYYTDILTETIQTDIGFAITYVFPSIENQKNEKEAYLKQYQQELEQLASTPIEQNKKTELRNKLEYDIAKFTNNVNKIKHIIGESETYTPPPPEIDRSTYDPADVTAALRSAASNNLIKKQRHADILAAIKEKEKEKV